MPLKRSTSTDAPADAAPDLETDGVEQDLVKVREILFGQQFREHTSELSRLESGIEQMNEALRGDVRAEISSLERMVTNKVNMITNRFTTEHNSRTTAIEEVTEKLNEMGRRLEAKIAEFEEKTANGQRDLREQLLSQSNLLNDAIQQRHEETLSVISQNVAELKTAKTDRSSLAGMLMDLASRLADDDESPAPRPGNGSGRGAAAS